MLKRHESKVTCLLYPNSENPRYDSSMLVSGSVDFSIILWNVFTGEMVHKFVVQTGEILHLSVPPNNVNPRILQCICSIASDHSVALLSLKECKPVMVASRHLFPVLFVKWRPVDDYLIVKCTDGGVYVWQIETGNLDRVAHGLIAEDIISAADENISGNQVINAEQLAQAKHKSAANMTTTLQQPISASSKSIANQTITLSHILQKRNFINANRGLKDEPKKPYDSSSTNHSLIVQPFHLNQKDPICHLLIFDIDTLLTALILEEQAIDSMIRAIRNNIYKEAHNAVNFQHLTLQPQHRTTPDLMHQHSIRRIASAKLCDSIDVKQLNSLKTKINYAHSVIKTTRIILSSLHVWSIDSALDNLFVSRLELLKPKNPIAFGQISRGAHLFVMFPPKRSLFNFNSDLIQLKPILPVVAHVPPPIPPRPSQNLIYFDERPPPPPPSLSPQAQTQTSKLVDVDMNTVDASSAAVSSSPSREFWLDAKSLTTEHLLAILALSNTFMNLQTFIDIQLKSENSDPIELVLGENNYFSPPTEQNNYGENQSLIKQAYSRLSTFYCMIADYSTASSQACSFQFKPLDLEILATKWIDPSFEIRESTQALLKNELKRIGPNGRVNLVKIWEPHLIALLKESSDMLQQQYVTSQPLSAPLQSLDSSQQQQGGSSQQLHLASSDMSMTQNISSLIRRKQYVAIIILGLIGAEFGQDVNASSNKTQAQNTAKAPQGFTIEDHSILKRISTSLLNLLTNKSLGYDTNRRASVDLIGRGFTVWEPFVEPKHAIFPILELCADAEIYLPNLLNNLPMSPIADMCRIARAALTSIANSRPKPFILTITKEIKLIGSYSGQSGQSSQSNLQYANALLRGKPEILLIIEKLIDNQAQDIFELLSDVIDIILFCVDPNQLKTMSMEDIFPPLFKFPMVRYCKETKRIIAGCHNGRLVMYDYRISKWHISTYPAHNNLPIVAVAISADSKYVGSYSAHDNTIYVWQNSGTLIFNIGSSSLKQIKVCNTAPLEISGPLTKLANLQWQNKTLNLFYYDNRKFSYQI